MSIVLTTKSRNFLPTSAGPLLDLDENLLNGGLKTGIPPANIYESDTGYSIELVAPGFEREDFSIEVDDSLVLTLSAEVEEDVEEEDEGIKRREFSYSSFSRSFQLPDDAIADEIDASYENGVLSLMIPKDEEVPLQPSIKIKIN